MDIRAAEISDIIRKQIENYDKKVSVTETGTVLTAGDGIARVYGLSGALAGELLEFEGGGGEKVVDRRRQVRLIAIAVVVILLGWFAVANTRKVQIDFWVFHRQAPLILVILISGLLGALIALLIMRRKPKAEE